MNTELPQEVIERFRRLALRKVARQELESERPTMDEVSLGNAVLMLADEVSRLRREAL